MTQVLLVDDDPHLLRALSVNLSAHDYDVVTAIDGASALAAATRSQPDVVIDLALPDVDGTELVREIRRLWPVPVIVLSARQGEEHKVAALDAGADDYVTKPYGAC